MDKRITKRLVYGISLILLSIAVYIFVDQISPSNDGTAYQFEKLFKSAIVSLIGLISLRIILFAFIAPLEKKIGAPIHNIIKDIIGIIVLLITAIIIITQVYGESAYIIVSFLAGSAIIIGFAIQDFLKQLVAGLQIDFQTEFRVGDWVKLPDGAIGTIYRIKLTRTEILLVNNTMLYINNSKILDGSLINLNQPDTPFFNFISVILEPSIPVERGRRILTAAVVDCEDIYDKTVTVVAESVQNTGVVYDIFFKLPNQDRFFELRHQIISAITRKLRSHNLKLCEISGEHKVRSISNIPVLLNDIATTNELSSLKLSGLLHGCSNAIQKHFSEKMKKLHFSIGDTIVSENEAGDTMFIVAEGLVETFVSKYVGEKKSTSKVLTLSDGDYFGEESLLRGAPRHVTAIAKTNVLLFKIDRETILSFMKQYPEFGEKLSEAIIAKRLNDESIKSDPIIKSNKKEEMISEFLESSKKFLGV